MWRKFNKNKYIAFIENNKDLLLTGLHWYLKLRITY